MFGSGKNHAKETFLFLSLFYKIIDKSSLSFIASQKIAEKAARLQVMIRVRNMEGNAVAALFGANGSIFWVIFLHTKRHHFLELIHSDPQQKVL